MESKLMVPNDDTLPIWSSKQKKPQKEDCSSRDFALAAVHLEKLQEGHSDLSCPVLGCRDRISCGSLRQCILQDIVPQAPADTEQRLSWTLAGQSPSWGFPSTEPLPHQAAVEEGTLLPSHLSSPSTFQGAQPPRLSTMVLLHLFMGCIVHLTISPFLFLLAKAERRGPSNH